MTAKKERRLAPARKPGRQTRTDAKAVRMLRVRLTDEEFAELKRRSDRAGKSMSDYIRDRALA